MLPDRYKFGFLNPSLTYHWNQYVWTGAFRFCRDHGIDLINFSGLQIDPDGDKPSNQLFYLASHVAIDGLIVMGETLAHDLEPSEFMSFIHTFRHLPLVNIGMELPGISSVIVDDFGGMREAVKHLIEMHSCHAMVFLEGPKGHIQAENRKAGFISAVEEFGLKLSDQVFLPGAFTEHAGRDAAKFISGLDTIPDALVTVNDITAIAAISELARFDIRVPEDIKLFGFDDSELALSQETPISSVAQHPESQGYAAARELSSILSGNPKNFLIEIPVSCYFRESCSCVSDSSEYDPLRCRQEVDRRIKVDIAQQALAGFNRRIISIHSMQDLYNNMDWLCYEMNIRSCYLIRHPDPGLHLEQKEILYSYDILREIYPRPGIHSFLHGELLSCCWPFSEQNVASVVPFFTENVFLGYCLFETDEFTAAYVEHMSAQIGNVLRQLELTRQRDERSFELEQSLIRLKTTQNQLIEAEKMASLGVLVAGIAHEINTPIGVSLTAFSYFLDESERIQKAAVSASQTRDDLYELIDSTSGIVLDNLNRAAQMVTNFRKVAADQTEDTERAISIVEYLDEISTGLLHLLRKGDHSFKVHCPDDIRIKTYPGILFQVITNFVHNSVEHGFEHQSQGVIELSVEHDVDEIVFYYSDNGRGIEPELCDRIFDPFVTSARNKGKAGLGLHIVYNLVSQKLKGSIKVVDSTAGAKFKVSIPANLVKD